MASKIEIMEALEGLAVHCRPPLMSVEGRTSWMRDWCDDLADYDITAIREACKRWRHGADRKFPLPGQLMAVANQFERRDHKPAPQLWGPVSDEEYQSMGLMDKIRHQELLAMDCRGRAGPMMLNGQHIALEDMPPTFHDWCRRSDNHYAEAKRLRAFMKVEDRRA